MRESQDPPRRPQGARRGRARPVRIPIGCVFLYLLWFVRVVDGWGGGIVKYGVGLLWQLEDPSRPARGGRPGPVRFCVLFLWGGVMDRGCV